MSRIEKALKRALEQQGSVREGKDGTPEQTALSDLRREVQPIGRGAAIGVMSQHETLLSPFQRSLLKIISPELSRSPTVKAFRELRTKIGQRVAPNASILVTGVVDNGGCSFVALNLAAAIAFDGARTSLLVDCSLRDRSLSHLLSLTSKLGLSDFLDSDQLAVADIVHIVGVERLRFVPAGRSPDERSEYFTMEKTRRLFGELSARYPDRQLVLDAPPITVSADAQILASICDHVLLVVPYGRVTESRLQTAVKSIDSEKLLGVIMNDEPTLPRSEHRFVGRASSAGQEQK